MSASRAIRHGGLIDIVERVKGILHNPWLVLFSVGLGLFMVVIDITILNIAMPAIAGELDASLPQVQWILIAYTLALTGLVPFFGRVSDVLGRKRLFVIGVSAFAAASLLAASSRTIGWLIAARVLQAGGGALITSNVLAIITDTFPKGKRGTAMGVQAILISGGAAVGPTLGGLLVTRFGWEAVFLINVPIALVAALLATVTLPPLRSHRTLEPLDWLGAGLLFAGSSALLLGVTKAPDWGWGSPAVWSLIPAGIGLLGLFVWRERRAPYPLIDLSLFRIRAFTAGQTAGAFATIAMATVMLLMPFYWQGVRGFSAQTTGLFMLPLPLAFMVVAPLSGRLSDRVGARGIASSGLGLVMLALLAFSGITATSPVPDVLWRLLLLGVGMGMFIAPNNNAVMSAAPDDKRGVASGLLGMFRYTGQSLGVAFGGTVFALFASGGGAGAIPLPVPERLAASVSDAEPAATAAFIHGLHAAALGAIPLAAVGVALSLLRGKGR